MTTKTCPSIGCVPASEVSASRRASGWRGVAIVLATTLFLGTAWGTARGEDSMQAGVDELMRAYTGNVPGASVLVLKDGAPILRRSYGLADVEKHVAATPETNYRLASVTKQFTAA